MTPHPLAPLIQGLKTLHRSLLHAAKADYERSHGKIDSPGTLLRLATSDPSFAFLRPLSELIVDLDEEVDEGGSDVGALGAELRRELDELFGLSRSGARAGFTERYRALMQADPDVVMEHARIRALVGQLPQPREGADVADVLHERHRWAQKRKFDGSAASLRRADGESAAIDDRVDVVDEASDESFPASDPPGWIDEPSR